MFSLHQRNFKRIKEKLIQELCHVEGIIWSSFDLPVQIIDSLENNRKIYTPEPKLKNPTNRMEVIKYKVLHKHYKANKQKFETDWLRLYSAI